MVSPFLRWPGGKARLLPRLRPMLRVEHGGYLEPFMGGAAVVLDLRPPRAMLGDANAALVETYERVREDLDGVIAALRLHEFTAEHYSEIRDMDPASVAMLSPSARAARFVFLNRAGFNGLQRTNASGENNVSFGGFDARKLPSLEQRIRECARALHGAEFMTGDFAATLARAKSGDLAFVDPPYDAVFTGYNAGGFSAADQERLAGTLHELSDQGVKIVTTNSDTPRVRSLYSDPRWTVHETVRRSGMAGDATARRSVTELAITNYQPEPVKTYSAPKHQAVIMTDGTPSAPGPSLQPEGGMAQQSKRLSDADVRLRTEFVQELRKAGMGRAEISKIFRERFGGSIRTADAYLRRAREAFMVEAVPVQSLAESRNTEREAFASKVEQDIAEAKAAGVWNAVSSLRRLEAEVRGLRQLAPMATPAAPSVSTTNHTLILNLSDSERAHRTALLERVLERRRQATAPVDTDGESNGTE